jgi:hypothetical protein
VVQFRGLNMNLPVDVRDMRGELRVAEGTLGGNFGFRGAVLGAQLTVFDRFFQDLSLNIEYDPNFLRLSGIESRLYAGRMRGSIDVHLAEPGAFRVQVRAEEVELGEMLERDMRKDDRLSGKVAMSLEFESPSGELEDIRGRGQVRVTEGQLFKIPGMRSILAVIGRVTPLNDEVRFREAEVEFDLDGELFRIHSYLLSTPVNDIRGRGTISLYGDLDLVVEPQVTRLIDLPRLVNVPVLSALRNLVHRTIYAIRLEGTVDSPAIRLQAFPFVKREQKRYVQSAHAGRVERMRPRILPGPSRSLQ